MLIEKREWLASAEAIEWFIELHGAQTGPNAPILRILENLRRAGSEDRTVAPVFLSDAYRRITALHDVYGGRMLAWSIAVLANRGASVQIDASLVRDELCGSDSSQAALTMPGGIGTLHLAARCVHIAGGRVRLAGNTSKGQKRPDVTWEPRPGCVVVLERKDRAFFRSATEDVDSLRRSMIRGALGARSQLRLEPNALCLAVSGAVAQGDVANAAVEDIASEAAASFERKYQEDGTSPAGAIFMACGYDAARRPTATHVSNVVQFQAATEATRVAWNAVAEVFDRDRLRDSGALSGDDE